MDRILIQDTDKDILDIVSIVLTEGGFNVLATDGCAKLLEQIDHFRPHVVILDYRLNGAECIAAYKEIRTRYSHLPVLAMSCNSNIHLEYSKFGFDGYIEKPFDLDQMYSILRRHIPDRSGMSIK